VEARQLALALGVGGTGAYTGWYRLFEAEAITRERSRVIPLYDWLDLEFVEDECPPVEQFEPAIRSAVDAIAKRFGWRHGPKVRVAILAAEADAPWAIGRYGYMTDKFPYDKICVPNRALRDRGTLEVTVAHEYAHVIVLNGAEGKAPTWLDEAIAMLAEPHLDRNARQAFVSGRAEWLAPEALDRAFHAERRDGDNSRRVYLAYQQAAWLGRTIVSCCGEAKVARLLEGFVNNSTWNELRMRLTGQHPADEALREVYGMRETELFARTLHDLRTGG
jgi:hypothetical protein